MQNQIQVLKQTELLGRQFTVYGSAEEPLFLAQEVATIIGHTKPSIMVDMVDDDEKLKETMFTSGQNREVWMLTENGLYEVLMQSRKPIAKQFKKGVKQILHDIRTKGGYMAAIANETPEQTMARAIMIAQETLKRQQTQIEQQQKTIAQKNSIISDQKQQIEASKPAVTFTNAVSGSQSACLIGELAKLICQNGVQIGQNRLFEWLRKNHYLGSVGERRNIPNQEYVEQGLFIVKKGVRTGNDGVLYTTKTTKVTGKGQVYFINKFLNKDKKKENELQNNNA